MSTQKKQEIYKHLHTIRNHLQVIYLLTEQTYAVKSAQDLQDIQCSAETIAEEIKEIEKIL